MRSDYFNTQDTQEEIQEKVPHSIELEQVVLGSILINNDSIDVISEILEAGHFFDPVHGKIYHTMLQLRTGNHVISPETLSNYMETSDYIRNGLTIKQYLGKLVSNSVGIMEIESHAQIVRELSVARSSIIIGEDLAYAMKHRDVDAKTEDILEEALDDLFRLSCQTDSGHKAIHIGEATTQVIAELNSPEKRSYVPSGLNDLNNLIGGYHNGNTIFIGGRPAMGKSALGQSEALKQAQNGFGVAFFSLEMSHAEITQRMISDRLYSSTGAIPYNSMRSRDLQSYEIEKIKHIRGEIQDLPLYIYDKRGLGVPEIAAQCRVIDRELRRRGKKLDVVYIDYLGKLQASGRYRGNKVYEIGEISEGLSTLAGNLNVPFIIMHQLNREVENRKDKRPQLSDMRSSGDIEQDAHVILFPFRPHYYLKQEYAQATETDEIESLQEKMKATENIMHITVAKQRNGPTGQVTVNAFMGSNAIRNRLV